VRKEREGNPCTNLGRIRRKRNLIIERRDSNLLSIETVEIKFSKNNILRMNPRINTPWEKE
jgi:hypothetical protein